MIFDRCWGPVGMLTFSFLTSLSSLSFAQPATTTDRSATTAITPDRIHKGFYFRGGLGVGYGGTKFTYESTTNEVTASGTGLGLDLWFGGTPVSGLAIGGALHLQQTINPSLALNGRTVGNASIRLNTVLIGPFADWFPDPRGGFHLGGTLGFAYLSLRDKNDDTVGRSPLGFGAAFFLGYDWWVSKEWSLGITGRLMGASVSEDQNNGSNVKALSYHPALLFSVLYY